MALLEKALALLLSAAMSPTVLPLLRAAVRSIMSDELVNAPGRGVADDEFEKIVVESGMADILLPGKHPDG